MPTTADPDCDIQGLALFCSVIENLIYLTSRLSDKTGNFKVLIWTSVTATAQFFWTFNGMNLL